MFQLENLEETSSQLEFRIESMRSHCSPRLAFANRPNLEIGSGPNFTRAQIIFGLRSANIAGEERLCICAVQVGCVPGPRNSGPMLTLIVKMRSPKHFTPLCKTSNGLINCGPIDKTTPTNKTMTWFLFLLSVDSVHTYITWERKRKKVERRQGDVENREKRLVKRWTRYGWLMERHRFASFSLAFRSRSSSHNRSNNENDGDKIIRMVNSHWNGLLQLPANMIDNQWCFLVNKKLWQNSLIASDFQSVFIYVCKTNYFHLLKTWLQFRKP